MKKIKLMLIASAIVLAGAAVYAQSHKAPRTFDAVFQYMGGGENDPSKYNKVPAAPSCPEGQTNICYIIAPENGSTGHPVLSTGLQDRITERDESEGDVFLKQ